MNIFGSIASSLQRERNHGQRETKIPYLDLEFKRETAGEPGVEVDLVIEIEGGESHRVVDGVLLQDGRQVLRVHGRMIAPVELVSFYKIGGNNQDGSIVETLTAYQTIWVRIFFFSYKIAIRESNCVDEIKVSMQYVWQYLFLNQCDQVVFEPTCVSFKY